MLLFAADSSAVLLAVSLGILGFGLGGNATIFMKEAVKYMSKQGGGSIINISSVGGPVPDISQVAYGTSKAAINYLTKLIAVHEAKNNIRCNAVLPGMTATDAVEKNLTEKFRELFLRHIPLKRMGTPEKLPRLLFILQVTNLPIPQDKFSLRQVVTAVSDGAVAVHYAEEYLSKS